MKTSIHLLALLVSMASTGSASDMPPVVVSSVSENFNWTNPFVGSDSQTPKGYKATCEATATFRARQIQLHDLQKEPPQGLAPWADNLKYFFGGRPFPGSWDGVDATGLSRDVILMECADVPRAVKDWILEQKKDEDNDNRYLFAVYGKPYQRGDKFKMQANLDEGKDEHKVILFAAGAIYNILPLWVADGSECEGMCLLAMRRT